MYPTAVSPQVRRFLMPLEDALRHSNAWAAMARLITLGSILQAYEDVMRAQTRSTQLDLFERAARSGNAPLVAATLDPSKT